MRLLLGLAAVGLLAISACEVSAQNRAAASLKPVPLNSGKAKLAPDNTSIRFVGIHLPPREPDPRTGGFDKFQGEVAVGPDKQLTSLRVEIDTTSLWTEVGGRLTNHLKSGDFFDVREHPSAKFESTRIEPAEGGQVRITGNLTLHGVTKQISFPAEVKASDAGLTLHSQFSIRRSDFGMTYGPDQVGNEVKLTAIVGRPNR